MAHATEVERSIAFYRMLGFGVLNSLADQSGKLRWVYLQSQNAHIMFARASGAVVPEDQAVLFYLYTTDVAALREHLLAESVSVSAITYPEYMPKGEIRITDPDGYVLLIGEME